MNAKAIAKLFYGFFAVVFLVTGISVLLLRTGLLPDFARNIVIGVAQGDSNALHLIQELGSLLVFAGLITFWFIRHYEQSRSFHWAMTTFWGLFALVHWFDAGGRPIESISHPLTNTIPFILFLLVGLLRGTSEKKLTDEA